MHALRRGAVFVGWAVAGVWLALALGGCAPAPVRIQGSGIEAPAPLGYIVWCAENPTDPLCGAKK